MIRTANAEVGRGLQNPAYKYWQKLPGRPSKGQAAITKFHSMMASLLQEVTTPLVYAYLQLAGRSSRRRRASAVEGGLVGFLAVSVMIYEYR